MNPELQKQLAEMLAKLTDATSGAASFAGSQVGPLIQEKILYGRIQETVGLVVFSALCVWMARVCRRAISEAREDDCIDELGPMVRAGLSGVGAGVTFIIATIQCDAAVMAWFAPRLYIVEWLKTMVTK